MRFMMLMIPRVYQGADAGKLSADFAPSTEAVAAMMKYNEDLAKAGALIALDGLSPLNMGTRIEFPAGKGTVVDGPHSESKEVLGGYWMIDVTCREEAIAWAKRCPASSNETIEIRQVMEMSDFPPDVQPAAAGFDELRSRPER